MHRNCRAISVFRNQCRCRSLATASAAQLKPKPQQPTSNAHPFGRDTSDSRTSPSAKSWSRPPIPPAPPSPRLPPKNWAPLSQRQTTFSSPSIKKKDPTRLSPAQPPSPSLSSSSKERSQPTKEHPTPKNWSRPQQPGTFPSSCASTEKVNARPQSSSLNPSSIQHTIMPKSWTSPPLIPSSLSTKDKVPREASTSPSTSRNALRPRSSLPSLSSRPSTRSGTPGSKPPNLRSNEKNGEHNKSMLHRQPLGNQKSSGQGIRAGINIRSKASIQQRTAPSATALKNSVKQRKQTQGRRKEVFIPSTLTVASLASFLRVKLGYLQKTMKRVGMAEEASYDYILTSDYAILLAEELGFSPTVDDEAAFDILPPAPHPNPSSLPSRPPIVTIMGHVDHGKTTLLDTLRSASVAKGEAGGITQHIGAFSVPVTDQSSSPAGGPQSITFLDTPGHAAFSAMRARGADVTDIIVLVVAADDGIMPQTKEVINLLKREDPQLNLVVAINKVDKPSADTDAVKKALMAEGVQLEDFGGDIPAVHVSGLTGEGLPELVETLSAVAEMQDLRAEQDGPGFGHVLESNFHKGLGPVATVLIQRGCLKLGSQVICGVSQGKVRRMTDSNGTSVQKALPGMAVTVSGWKTLPKAGDEVLEGSDADIKKALSNRVRKAEEESKQQDIEMINASRRHDRNARAEGLDARPVQNAQSGPKELKLIIKADVSGSGEALEGALNAMGNNVAVSKVISTGVGDITESDVMLAKAANATLVGFSVSVPRSIRNLAAQNAVPLFTSDIIYRLVDDVRANLIDMLPKILETKVVGEANVQQVFDIQIKGGQKMKVAGCRVINGLVEKQKLARVVRAGATIHEGSLDTMRQLKKDITEARKGLECGLSLKDFTDLQEGDLIQMYETIEKPGIL